MLIFQFFSFQTGKSTQTHIYNCLRLYFCKTEAFHQSFFCNLCSLAASYNLNYFINIIKSNQ